MKCFIYFHLLPPSNVNTGIFLFFKYCFGIFERLPEALPEKELFYILYFSVVFELEWPVFPSWYAFLLKVTCYVFFLFIFIYFSRKWLAVAMPFFYEFHFIISLVILVPILVHMPASFLKACYLILCSFLMTASAFAAL